MTRIAWILDKIVALAGHIGLVCVTLMMLHVTADVVGRYVFNAPVGGTITIVSNYYMVILGFGALAVAESRDAHISVEVVADLMPRSVQPALGVLAAVISIGAFSLLAARGWLEAERQADMGAALQQGTLTIPIWPSYYAVPLGCGLMAIVSLWKLITTLAGRPSGFVGPDSMKDSLHD